MAYTTINKGSSYFNTVLYTGNGSTLNVTGVGFQPDFVWIKCRDIAYNHRLYDAVRGVLKSVNSNLDVIEETTIGGVSAYNVDGYTNIQNADSESNNNGVNYCSWNWLGANTTVSNTQGTITSTVSANTTAGFSVVKWTGNNTSGATVGHGLGSVLKMIIVKNLNTTDSWNVYHVSNGNTKRIFLNTSGATDTTASAWNNTTPTSSVFTIGNNTGVNNSGSNLIAYCFADVKGYSKFGSYTGNGSADGPFVYTGFKPAYIMIKQSDASGEGWFILDNKRETINPLGTLLIANDAGTDNTSQNPILDFTSNGFKLRRTWVGVNGSGATYIYMVFAENPFVSSTQIPVTAR
jgi:hypothetical protein